MGRSQVLYNRSKGGRGRGRGGAGRGKNRRQKDAPTEYSQTPPERWQPDHKMTRTRSGVEASSSIDEDVVLLEASISSQRYVMPATTEYASSGIMSFHSLMSQHDNEPPLVERMNEVLKHLPLAELYGIPTYLMETLTISGEDDEEDAIVEEEDSSQQEGKSSKGDGDSTAISSLSTATAKNARAPAVRRDPSADRLRLGLGLNNNIQQMQKRQIITEVQFKRSTLLRHANSPNSSAKRANNKEERGLVVAIPSVPSRLNNQQRPPTSSPVASPSTAAVINRPTLVGSPNANNVTSPISRQLRSDSVEPSDKANVEGWNDTTDADSTFRRAALSASRSAADGPPIPREETDAPSVKDMLQVQPVISETSTARAVDRGGRPPAAGPNTKLIPKQIDNPTTNLPRTGEEEDMDEWLEEALKTQSYDTANASQPEEEPSELEGWLDSVI